MTLPSLLLERIAVTKHFAVDPRAADEPTMAALLQLCDEGLVTEENHGFGWVGFTITDRGTACRSGLVLSSLVASPDVSASSGDVALWVWLLLHGGEVPRYASLTVDVLHLLVCGLNLEDSSSVRDDERWSGVGGQATCRCGKVSRLYLIAEVDSVTDLLRHALMW